MSKPVSKRRVAVIPPGKERVRQHLEVIKTCCTATNVMGQPVRDYSAGVRDTLLWVLNGGEPPLDDQEPRCRECGCTEGDCAYCIKRTGKPCSWVEKDLCSACAPEVRG